MLESLIIFTGILCVINLISLSIGEDGGKKLSRWWGWQKERFLKVIVFGDGKECAEKRIVENDGRKNKMKIP